MKRKKLYSVLAYGLALSLVVGVPVSAAGSPTTVENEDGSTTTTVENEDGSTTATTTNKDGSTESVTTKQEGNTTTTTTVSTDADGKTVGTVEKVEEKAENGSTKTTTTEKDADGNYTNRTEIVVKTDGSTVETKTELGSTGNPISATKTEVKKNEDGVEETKKQQIEYDARGNETIVVETVETDEGLVSLGKKVEASPVIEPEVGIVRAENVSVETRKLTDDEKKQYTKDAVKYLNKVADWENISSANGVDWIDITPVEPEHLAAAEDAVTEVLKEIIRQNNFKTPTALTDDSEDLYEFLTAVEMKNVARGDKISIPLIGEEVDTDNFMYFVMHYDVENGFWETLPVQFVGNELVVKITSNSPFFITKIAALEKDDANVSNGSSDYDPATDIGRLIEEGKYDLPVGLAKADSTPAVTGTIVAVPSNPAVSPKTGE